VNGPGLRELYVDEHLLVVDKPSGMLVHRGWGRDRVTAVDQVREMLASRVHPLHRLDRGASGALAFARRPDVARLMQPAFHDGRVSKCYLALVRGIAPASCVVDHPVPRTPRGPRVPAVTALRRLGIFERYSLVEAQPRTGRLHQVRRHLKHLSLPVIGDSNYGKGEHNRLLARRFGLARLALHAWELAFDHPATGERVCVRAPVPLDLAEPLGRMGLGAVWAEA
jgi:tRNA pseudouridine65 synthase